MPKILNKKSNLIKGNITDIVPVSNLRSLRITFSFSVEKEHDLIYKKSASLIQAFNNILNANKSISLNTLIFKHVHTFNAINYTETIYTRVSKSQFTKDFNEGFLLNTNGIFIIENRSNLNNFVLNQINNITVTGLLSTKYTQQEFDLKFQNFTFDAQGNAENFLYFEKLGAPKSVNSGTLTKSIKNILKENSSEIGTLPSSIITDGKKLQNYNDSFKEYNLFEFKENQTNSAQGIGLPVRKTYSNSESREDQLYITSDQNLLDKNNFNRSEYYFDDQFYVYGNSKVIHSPNSLGPVENLLFSNKNIDKKDLDSVIKQKRFNEEFTPYDESLYTLSSNSNDPLKIENNSFYNKTINRTNKKNYALSNEKQIKIILKVNKDNTNNGVDLHLLNTKFAHNNEDPSADIDGFSDSITNTTYMNFLNDTSFSISSHFMPTAYWDFANNEWNYLEGIKLNNSNYNSWKHILGYRNDLFQNSSLYRTDILKSFSKQSETIDALQENIDLRNIMHFAKPLLTTPGMRNDGSFLENNHGDIYNKNPIGQITDTYGFPWKATWQSQSDHQLDMSNYISKDFLLEKIIIKGKYTSKGEMPVKKGNYYSKYLDDQGLEFSNFNDPYTMKDDHNGVVSNNITFFILNERKNENFFENNINVSPIQSYSFFNFENQNNLSLQTVDGIKYTNQLNDRLYKREGEFSSYFGFNHDVANKHTISVDSFELQVDKLYNIDDFNKKNISNDFKYYDYIGGQIGSFNYSNFVKIKNSNQSSVGSLETIRKYSPENWNENNFNVNLTNQPFAEVERLFLFEKTTLLYNDPDVLIDSSLDKLDTSRSRDLVTYSNLLLVSKENNVSLDEKVFTNIDKKITLQSSQDNILNLNVSTPQSFVITSFCKNQNISDYTDESEYKIKSNLSLADPSDEGNNYYHASYNLEGKFLGEPNGLGISSDRIIDREVFALDKKYDSYKTKSGKYIQSNNESLSIVKSNYILKPEDRLVFGVSSNSNGQVMPTVFQLHDELEITLVGRDFLDNTQYKNNYSKSIRKPVIGDNYIDKSGHSVSQTKNSYFDNVWENIRNKSNNIEKKILLGNNSSKEFGTYSGVITLKEENNKNFIKDTVNPSLGFIYKNCYQKNEVKLYDFSNIRNSNIFTLNDLSYDYNDVISIVSSLINDNSLKIGISSTNKIVLTENFTSTELQGYDQNNAFINSLISDWHNTHHLNRFKNLLQQDENIVIDDYTRNYFEEDVQVYIDKDSFTCNSIPLQNLNLLQSLYSFNNEYSNIISTYSDQNQINVNDSNFKLFMDYEQRYKQSLKNFVLPKVTFNKYQHGIQIKNYENFYSKDRDLINNFILSNKNTSFYQNSNPVENVDFVVIQNPSQNSNIEGCSLQYLSLDDPSKTNLREYCSDIIFDSDKNNINENSQWHLVIQMQKDKFKYLISNLNEETKKKYLSSFSFSNRNTFPELHLFLNPINVLNNNNLNFEKVHKCARIHVKDSNITIPVTQIVKGETYRINSGPNSSITTQDSGYNFISEFGASSNIVGEEFTANRDGVEGVDTDIPTVNKLEDLYLLLVPLYFWETLEINDQYLQSKSFYSNIRQSLSDIHDTYPSWYAALNNGETVKDYDLYRCFLNDDDYPSYELGGKHFPPDLVKVVDLFKVPYTIQEFKDATFTRDDNVVLNFNFERNLLINENYDLEVSLANFSNNNSLNEKLVIDKKSNDIEKLRNNFEIVNKNTDFFIHEKYFENNRVLLDNRLDRIFSPDISDYQLNEKVYRSKIYKKSGSSFIETQYYLIYKINEAYIRSYTNSQLSFLNDDNNDSVNNDAPANSYYIIDLICFDSNNSTLRKDYINFENKMFNITRNDTIRIYENSLKDNYSLNQNQNNQSQKFNNVPYFDIDLSMKTIDLFLNKEVNSGEFIPGFKYKISVALNTDFVSEHSADDNNVDTEFIAQTEGTGNGKAICLESYTSNIIDFTYFKIQKNNTFSLRENATNKIIPLDLSENSTLTSENFESLYDNSIVNADSFLYNTRSFGTPIFEIKDNLSYFNSAENLENNLKNFMYGFSKRKDRYPVDKLDGFKYGVENGSKKSLNYFYSNKSYGNFSDKVMGSTNTTFVKKGNAGENIISRPVERRFVNQNYRFISEDSALYTYNKDIYCRSTYPYIEDETNELSQYYVNVS